MARETNTPQIPQVTEELLSDAVRAIKEIVEVREGRRGDPLDEMVTYRDLVALGLAKDNQAGAYGTNDPNTRRPVTVPTVPPPSPGINDEIAYVPISQTIDLVVQDVLNSQLLRDLRSRIEGLENGVWVPAYINDLVVQSRSLARESATLISEMNGQRSAVQQVMEANEGLSAKYTVKVDAGGHVAGFGLAAYTNKDLTRSSEFGITADRFFIAPPAESSNSAPTLNLYKGKVWVDTSVTPSITRYYTGSDWSTSQSYATVPFVVRTSPFTTQEGVVVQPGVYMSSAFISDLKADKIATGSLNATQYIQSTGFVTGSTGWKINGNGVAEFSQVTVRGTVYASSGSIGGNTISSTSIASPGRTGYSTGSAGFYLGSDGKASFGNPSGARIQWTGTAVEVYNSANVLTLSSGGVETRRNLARSFKVWTHGGTNWTNLSNETAADATSLVIPTGSNLQASSFLLGTLPAGNYTISFRVNSSGARTLYVDLYPDTLPESSFVLTADAAWRRYSFNWTVNATTSGVSLRFFAGAGAGQVEIVDVKLEAGTEASQWTPHVLDVTAINNPITASNASTYIADSAIGSAQIGSLAVDTLQIMGNAVTVPTVDRRSDALYGDGATVIAAEASITLLYPGWIYATFSSSQYYGSGVIESWATLDIAGQQVTVGGYAATTNIAVSDAKYLAAGTHSVKAYWYGVNSGVHIGDRVLFVMGVKK